MKPFLTLLALTIILTGCSFLGPDLLRDHKNGDPEKCATMRFECPEGQTYFSDKTGCGCEYYKDYEIPPPGDCPNTDAPVCANGETYQNTCYAELHGATEIVEGECS